MLCSLEPLFALFYPAPREGALSDNARLTFGCLTSVCLSRTSGLSREQRGLGRLKLAQRYPTSYVTRTPLSTKINFQGAGAYCGGLPHGLFCVCLCSISWLIWFIGCQYQCKWLTWKTRLRNDLYCVGEDVKLYSLSHSLLRVEKSHSNDTGTVRGVRIKMQLLMLI